MIIDSRSDSHAMSCGLWVICYKYFIFSKRSFRIFEHDLAAIFLLRSCRAQYCITIGPHNPNWLFFDKFDRSLTSDDFLWPDLTFNDIEFQSTTKLLIETNVYLGYFDQPARIDPYWTGWPKFDLWWPLLTSKNIKSESLRNVLVKTYVYWIYFD